MNTKTHIALVSIPIYSHLRSILEFSKRLVHLHQDIHVTCIIPTTGSICSNTKALVESLPSSIDYMFLPPPNLDDLPQDFHPALLVLVATSRSMQSIDDALKKIHSRSSLVAIVCDGLITQVLYLSKKLNISSFIYFPSNMMLLSLVLYSPKMDETMTCEYRDLLEPLELPGCVPIDGKDLPEPLQDRSGEEYKVFIEGNKRFYLADGVLVNSFIDMEAETIRVLHEEGNKIPYAYAIGPFIQKGSSRRDESCLRWLDEQEDNSVLYISFGSGGALSQDQLNELAWGLELSGQKFIWVLRSPSKFGFVNDLSLANEDPLQFIPSGFLERTKDQGLVVPYWAPQIEILSHSAIGGFISHCGWNSTLESVVNGVPMITWPLFAEQKMNAAILSKGLKVAVRPKVNEKGIVEREEVAMVIKNIMVGEEGKGIRQRMKELKDAADNAVKQDGSSTRTLAELVLKWKSLGVAQCN
ncbi:hypothetical protein Lal_00011986 [Lupinus albus]|uniref:Glycosyltransferase n=1 Tax=Lupinus albus TaxID=3870 RepID=A0A6A4QBT2_LUPAL|nr:putative hydroquinone glucosyltransferase [Lupinus albus]KAF1877216.1 hypothetical protein Lal_00011986 [Lupinus albus]